MEIAIIGSGNVGGTLGKLWAAKGHQITFGVRDVSLLRGEFIPNTRFAVITEAIASSEVVVIATPANAVDEVIRGSSDWAGKTVIDTTNRLTPPSDDSTGSQAQDIARLIPGAHVVKAFNTLGANNFANPVFNGIPASMFLCGDDSGAKAKAAELIRELGFDVVDVGDLSFAPLLESLAKLWILMARGGYGRDFAFKVLKRS